MLASKSWLNAYILTFNCARNTIDTHTFASHLFDGLSKDSDPVNYPEVLVLSLQEVAPIAYAFLGGPFLEWYFDAFRLAVDLATPEDQRYQNVMTKNVGMTAIMVFVRDDFVDRIAWKEEAEVGVGVHQAGNKGAVGARIGYQVDYDSEDQLALTFISLHLAPDESALERRNQDWKDICQRLVFTGCDVAGQPVGPGAQHRQYDEEGTPLIPSYRGTSGDSGMYSLGTYLFVAGDVNYRTSHRDPQPGDISSFPQPTNDTSSRNHYMRLLAHDQLTKERLANRTMHHLSEQHIAFPPTYKYSLEARQGSLHHPEAGFKWAKNRWPSWCDRILYLENPYPGDQSSKVQVHHYGILPLFQTSDHRAVVLSLSVPLKAPPAIQDSIFSPPFSPPFDIDPEWQSKRSLARKKEVAIGIMAYLALTWEGNGLILATILGLAAGYFTLYGLG
ncbi:hypothetical protein MGYG_03613 [Nannizzia gypsea CBS 118893]|uniref:Inositol polyphosphate-related phosphatase domain-containing protein n=1 Tax=Arthroderma gypseum (strain ATCC MYA-4604 / CBS 118893) TaxID=535722 RepID=E4USZ4_ARTGP|nr:hypothetical protein MGYG_03613 [Nannizzia gypsea CBS 118893]EFR00607.1 hypothetical protein MGYG_03613 [Nannizzia gypsea CBS 118893]